MWHIGLVSARVEAKELDSGQAPAERGSGRMTLWRKLY